MKVEDINMKKQIVAIMLGATMLLTAGCGASDKASTEQTNETQANETQTDEAQSTEAAGEESGVSSAQMGVVPSEHVSELCDYSAVPISLSAVYEPSTENIQNVEMDLLNSYGLGSKEVSDRTTVQDGDYVKVDYTGYQNGEAFSGGTATDVLIDVSNNKDAEKGTGYITGFSDGLIGAEVGSTISSDVTFPEDYGVDSLNGQTVTFEFVVKGIYTPIGLDEVEDSAIADQFGATYGISDKSTLEDFVKQYIESNRYSALVSQIKDYVVKNSTYDIPEDYLKARLSEYEDIYEQTYCTDGQTLEEYFQDNYSMSLDEAEEQLLSILNEQIGVEFAFSVIADKEAIEMNEDEYAAYVQNFLSNDSLNFNSEEEVYEYFGAGNAADGETYLRNLYLVNKAIDHVADNAVVTYTE
ncbi:MAG: FKBP-type peptidyl-prolyl cis-trans isomerase [Agathobacter sp.]|nr:FKBP-type peptidyl-prolyl cis-trans isomerase [Agathobacter sp.]